MTNTWIPFQDVIRKIGLRLINSKVNAILSQKEKVVELSWWDLHKDKAYIIIALIIVVGVVYRRNK